jgi:hypothetical protein
MSVLGDLSAPDGHSGRTDEAVRTSNSASATRAEGTAACPGAKVSQRANLGLGHQMTNSDGGLPLRGTIV